MEPVTFVSGNANKFNSFKRDVEPFGVPVQHEQMELPEKQDPDMFLVAIDKANYAWRQLKRPLACQDSGFFLDARPGFPGTMTKFVLETLHIEDLIMLAENPYNWPEPIRGCEFQEYLTFSRGKDDGVTFKTVVRGTIALEPYTGELTGSAWSQIWRIFIPDGGAGKTLAEMTEDERTTWRNNHRRSAAQDFAKWYREQYGE